MGRFLRRYSRDGLTCFGSLKNRDRAVATVLHDMVREGHLHAQLVILTKSEGGSGRNADDFDYLESDAELKVEHVLPMDDTAEYESLLEDSDCYDDEFDEAAILQVGPKFVQALKYMLKLPCWSNAACDLSNLP